MREWRGDEESAKRKEGTGMTWDNLGGSGCGNGNNLNGNICDSERPNRAGGYGDGAGHNGVAMAVKRSLQRGNSTRAACQEEGTTTLTRKVSNSQY